MVAIQPWISLQRETVGVVGRAIQGLDALIRCREKGLIQPPRDRPDTPVEIGIESLAQGLGEVLEITGSSLRRSDEKDVVVVLVPKAPAFQLRLWNPGISGLPRRPGFPGVRDHLLQRRIGRQRIGQAAGRAGIGTPSSMAVGARLPWENLA